jgi:hypothetical protein
MQKNPGKWASLCGLQGIKIHRSEFLYDFALKRNKLLVGQLGGKNYGTETGRGFAGQ